MNYMESNQCNGCIVQSVCKERVDLWFICKYAQTIDKEYNISIDSWDGTGAYLIEPDGGAFWLKGKTTWELWNSLKKYIDNN